MTEFIDLGRKTYTLTPHSFIKSDKAESKRPLTYDGTPYVWEWGPQRLKNEHAALQLVAANTRIRVPKVIRLGRNEDGAAFLETERVPGIDACAVRSRCRAPPGAQQHVAPGAECAACERVAVDKINGYMREVVLPELRRLTSDATGLDGFVCPPQRILEYDKRPAWESRRATPGQRLVLCHCDLSQANIILDEETLDVAAIIDWEHAGFYPQELERPIWSLDLDEYHATYADHVQIEGDVKLITG